MIWTEIWSNYTENCRIELMSKKIIITIVLILLSAYGLVLLGQRMDLDTFKYAPQPGVTKDTETGFQFDGAIQGVVTSSELDSFTQKRKYIVTSIKEKSMGIDGAGILTIHSSDNLSWKEIYSLIEGDEGISYNTEEVELVDKYFENKDNCPINSDNSTLSICKSTNKFGAEYVSFEKRYHLGQYPTAVYYIYKLEGNRTIVAYYIYSPRHTTTDAFLITQQIAESIRR